MNDEEKQLKFEKFRKLFEEEILRYYTLSQEEREKAISAKREEIQKLVSEYLGDFISHFKDVRFTL